MINCPLKVNKSFTEHSIVSNIFTTLFNKCQQQHSGQLRCDTRYFRGIRTWSEAFPISWNCFHYHFVFQLRIDWYQNKLGAITDKRNGTDIHGMRHFGKAYRLGKVVGVRYWLYVDFMWTNPNLFLLSNLFFCYGLFSPTLINLFEMFRYWVKTNHLNFIGLSFLFHNSRDPCNVRFC